LKTLQLFVKHDTLHRYLLKCQTRGQPCLHIYITFGH